MGWGGLQALGGEGPRASVPGGVGGRGTGTRDGANFCSKELGPRPLGPRLGLGGGPRASIPGG